MTAIEFDNVGKMYRLGRVGTGTLSHDLNRWWTTSILRKEDPYLKIGETNDRSKKGHSDYVWALRDISFKVEQGDVVGIIGKNGAGKSTLLKLLSRITSPSTGSIRYQGRIASLLEVGTGFHPEMTGRENIYMNGSIMGMTKREITRKLDEIVDFAGVERYLDTPVKRYSSGMTVRLGFAVAAFLEPEILVVDEVLTVGDAEFQKKAIGKMNDVAQSGGRTVLFVSHNMAAVKNLCTRGVVLQNGQMVYDGNISDAVDLYLQQQNSVHYKEIIDSVHLCKDYIKVTNIEINGTHKSESVIKTNQEILQLVIEGESMESLDCEVKLRLKSTDGTPVVSLVEGHYRGTIYHVQDKFHIEKAIKLPRYLARGTYIVDLLLHRPKIDDYFKAYNCAVLYAEGSFDEFASPLDLKLDGFCGLESK